MSIRVLVTGFEPFGDSDDNPSMQVVNRLHAQPPSSVELATGVLPVTWSGAWPELQALIDDVRPDAVLLLGQSAKRPSVTVERFALNFGQGRLADNDAVERPAGPLVEGAPLALPATVDIEGMVTAMSATGLPTRASHDAGAFLCNAVLFLTLLHAVSHVQGMRAGFIHLPMLPGQRGAGEHEPTLPLEASERAVRSAISTLQW